MVIDAGQVFKRNGVEPFFDEISVHAVDDFCGLFSISAGHIKFRKADDLKAMLSGGGICTTTLSSTPCITKTEGSCAKTPER